MKILLTTFAVLFALSVSTGCKKDDPRCPEVAAAVGRIAVHQAAKQYGPDSEEMKSIQEQVEAQQEKVTKECNAKLAADDSGVWELWADCMATVSTAEEAMKCKSGAAQ